MQDNFRIVQCSECGTKNRIPSEKIGSQARCGKCHFLLQPVEDMDKKGDAYIFRCTHCGTRNRIPSGKVNSGERCGRCHSPLETEELFIPQPVLITDSNFDTKVLKSPLPVLVFAWAPWCPTCRAASPIIDDFAKESKGKVRVGNLNIDTNPGLASRFDILSVPHLYIFDGGNLKEDIPGALQKQEIMMKMAQYI